MRGLTKTSAVLAFSLVAATAFAGDGTIHRSAHRVAGSYVIVVDPGADMGSVASTLGKLNGARVHHQYGRGIKGFAVELSESDALQLSRDSRVQLVEEDSVFSSSQVAVPWDLDRIDQRTLPLDGSFVPGGDGAGVSVYVVDTGIRADHVDLYGRVAPGFTSVADSLGTDDCNGHGTHVAGLVGGTSYGAAKAATLVPVRVLDCSGAGTTSSVLAGLDWILSDHTTSGTPAVVNMSLAGPGSTALDNQVNQLFLAGITPVVAAGNSTVDACTVSPARVPNAITVGASNILDQKAPYSNFGACVDLFAPGSGVTSDWNTSPTAFAQSSGTSESAPLVAGIAAAWLSKYPSASPAAISQSVISSATLDALSGLDLASPNRLLFAGVGALDTTTLSALQLLSDPGFDQGNTFWSSDICTVINQTGCPPDDSLLSGVVTVMSYTGHSGKSHASLGGRTRSASVLSEAITVPTGPRRAELDFYLMIDARGQTRTAVDFLTVEIRDRSGVLLETLASFSNLDASATYKQHRVDLTKYKGATIRFAFVSTANHGQPTYFLLDDVSAQMWP